MALLEHSEDIFTGHEDPRRRLPRRLPPGAARRGIDARQHRSRSASQQYRWARGNFALAGTPLFKRMQLHRRCNASASGTAGSSTSRAHSARSSPCSCRSCRSPKRPRRSRSHRRRWCSRRSSPSSCLQPRWLHLPDGKASRRVGLISQVAHLYALRDHLTDRDQEWIPTGGNDRADGKQAPTASPTDRGRRAVRLRRSPWCCSRCVSRPVGRSSTSLPSRARGDRAARRARHDAARRHESDARSPHRAVDDGRDAFLDVVRACRSCESSLARARLLVDLVDVRRDARRLLRLGRGAGDEPAHAQLLDRGERHGCDG